MRNYKTPLSEKIKELEKEGYTTQYTFKDGALVNVEKGLSYQPDDIRLIREFRFEGESNPGDMAILYTVEDKNGDKGTIVNAYGTYADDDLFRFLNEAGKREI